jgi:hypothetical protein
MRAINQLLRWGGEEREDVDARVQLRKLPKQLMDVLNREEIQRVECAARPSETS